MNAVKNMGFLPNRPKLRNTWLFIIVIAIMTLALTLNWRSTLQSDMVWTIATGREILENGILYENPFTIDDIGIVVQQWLFAVLFALFTKLGIVGYCLFSLANFGILFVAGWVYLSQYNLSKISKFIIVGGTYCLLFKVLVGTRPECVTIAFLLFTCYALERWKETNKIKYLIILPVTMFLEVNLHSSMIWFHFLIILAYIVPSIATKYYETYGLLKKNVGIFLSFIVASCFAMFINPYGKDGVLYLVNTFRAHTFRYCNIYELNNILTEKFVYGFIAIGLIICMLVYLGFHKQLFNYQLYIAIGFMIIAFYQKRNTMFLFIVILVVIPFIAKQCENGEIAFNVKEIRLLAMIISIVGIGFMVLCSAIYINEMILYIYNSEDEIDFVNCTDYIQYGLSDVAEYLDTHVEDKTTVRFYTEFNTGGYFEYLGYRNIYMDARPEIYMKRINGVKDILPTFSAFYYKEMSVEEMQQFMDEYDFEYVLIAQNDYLNDYFENYEPKYDLAFDAESYQLYKRVQ